MAGKTLALFGGIVGAVLLSQFPEFSQQYVQRLGGAVAELSRLIDSYDADAAKVGLSREEALVQQASGGAFGEMRAKNMAATFRRYDDLRSSLWVLQDATAFERALHVFHLRDTDVARDALAAFRLGVPLNLGGAAFAGMGFFAGWCGVRLGFGLLLGVVRHIFGMRRNRV